MKYRYIYARWIKATLQNFSFGFSHGRVTHIDRSDGKTSYQNKPHWQWPRRQTQRIKIILAKDQIDQFHDGSQKHQTHQNIGQEDTQFYPKRGRFRGRCCAGYSSTRRGSRACGIRGGFESHVLQDDSSASVIVKSAMIIIITILREWGTYDMNNKSALGAMLSFPKTYRPGVFASVFFSDDDMTKSTSPSSSGEKEVSVISGTSTRLILLPIGAEDSPKSLLQRTFM